MVMEEMRKRMDNENKRMPSFIRHIVMVTRHSMVKTQRNASKELEFDVTVKGSGRTWCVSSTLTGIDKDGKPFTLIIAQEYVRAGKRSSMWSMMEPEISVNGEKNDKADTKVADVLAELLGDHSPQIGDQTKKRHTDTHGSRSNSVETRRASVIRV